ncbi:hypothetical protein Tcan_00531, partial [Toxocara canis]
MKNVSAKICSELLLILIVLKMILKIHAFSVYIRFLPSIYSRLEQLLPKQKLLCDFALEPVPNRLFCWNGIEQKRSVVVMLSPRMFAVMRRFNLTNVFCDLRLAAISDFRLTGSQLPLVFDEHFRWSTAQQLRAHIYIFRFMCLC